MALHFQQAPEASTNALQAMLPRIANRASVAANAPAIGATVNAALRRRPGAPTPAPAGPDAITAPVHVLGLDQIAAKKDIKAAPVRLWSHLLHAEGADAPTTVADIDAQTQAFAAMTEGEEITQLGKRIRSTEATHRTSGQDYDLALIRVPALSLTALWLKGRGGAPDQVIPNDSPQSPLTAGKTYSLDEFNAALAPVAQQILRETDPRKGG